ncbi:unnamed protein product [Rangifer tarandus platyrhynchus]|uniref:Uncharacterized protein n=3 Tax=Rangifer tarandus platyrhynchus TaxID=3082113 RepID=A0ACB0E4W0_RANTA|nr:unnamed protein product [Rangifer tarandus platyrhynchus]CAI9695516.1 unnamed protein product [Rangifer tarandus platyrhynchus]
MFQLRTRHPPLPSAAADGPTGMSAGRAEPYWGPRQPAGCSEQPVLGQVRNAQYPASRAWCGSGQTASPSHSAWSGDEMAQSEQVQCFRGGLAARDDVVGRHPLTSTGARGPDTGPPAPRPSSGWLDLWPPQRLSQVPHPEITPSGRARLCPRPATVVGAPLTTWD